MTLKAIRQRAETDYEETNEYSLSFWSIPNETVQAIVHAVRVQAEALGRRDIPHGSVQVSTAGAIRAAGYDLIPTPPPMHYSLVLPNPPTNDDYEAVMSAFDDPVPNPEGRLPS
jgi:hypothetical protein